MRPIPHLKLSTLKSAILASLVFGGMVLGVSYGEGSPQALLDRASQLVDQEKYDEAIPLYEAVIQKTPGNTRLQSNLVVLYFNRGVQLQNEEQFDAADALFDKGLAIQPKDPHLQKAKAASAYGRARQLDSSESASPKPYAIIYQQMDTAMKLDPKEAGYKKAKAGWLMEEATGYAQEKDLLKAVPLIEEAHGLDPEGTNIRRSLVNVYLGLANQQEGEAQEQWLGKALALDNSVDIQEQVAHIRQPKQSIPEGTLSFQRPQTSEASSSLVAGRNLGQLPAGASGMSMVEMIQGIEKNLGMDPGKKPLKARLIEAETQVYGSAQDGALKVRTKSLYATLFGSPLAKNPGTPQDELQGQFHSSGLSATAHYLDKVLAMTDGKVIRWGKFPVRVYIEEPKVKKFPQYRPEFRQAVQDAMTMWQEDTTGFVSFVQVGNPQAADIEFTWDDTYENRFHVTDEHPADVHYDKMERPKPSRLARVLNVASMFAPGPFYLAPQAASAALQYRQVKKLQALIDESKITLGLSGVTDLSEEEAQRYMRNMAAKELAHVLGIKVESDEPQDLTHEDIPTDRIKEPSPRDLATLQELYARPATVVLNVR